MMRLPLNFRRRVALAICPELAPEIAAGDLASTITHMPVWKSARRPLFWSDLEVRAFLTGAHRQMPLKQCLSDCEALFGPERKPSRSALHRYWCVLDEAHRKEN